MGQGLLRARARTAAALAAAVASLIAAPGCTHALFSAANPEPERDRPVARIETRGGVEYGVTTREGVLFLGRTAQEGPCRIYYFLGPTPLVQDGVVRHRGGVFYEADVDLKTQSIPLLDRDPAPSDELVAIAYLGPFEVAEVPVRLARDPGVEGDVLEWPGGTLAAGTGIFTRVDETLHLVGMVSAEAKIGDRRYVVFAGTDRMRELLATPRRFPARETVKHRPDDITVIKKR